MHTQTRDQNKLLSMPKPENPHYRKLKAQRKETTGEWGLGCRSNTRDWRNSYGRQIQICRHKKMKNLLDSEKLKVKLEVF